MDRADVKNAILNATSRYEIAVIITDAFERLDEALRFYKECAVDFPPAANPEM